MRIGKKTVLRLLGAAALALLVCLCFLGSTMARYTSSGTGSGTLTVALWDVESARVPIENAESVSPSDLAYDDEDLDGFPRVNRSDWIDAMNVLNYGDVAADVTFKMDPDDGIELEFYDGFTWEGGLSARGSANEYGKTLLSNIAAGGYGAWVAYPEHFSRVLNDEQTDQLTDENGYPLYEVNDIEGYFDELVDNWHIFSLEFGYRNDSGEVQPLDGGSVPVPAADGGEPGSATICAKVVWLSVSGAMVDDDEREEVIEEMGLDLDPDSFNQRKLMYSLPSAYGGGDDGTGNDDWGGFSDAVDTIIGMYVETIAFNVTWTAVQASTLP